MPKPTEGKNTDPSPMEFESITVPSRISERNRIRANAETMTLAELQESATSLGLDTAGLRTKREVADAIIGTGSAGPTDATT